jgi:hypothetical protein
MCASAGCVVATPERRHLRRRSINHQGDGSIKHQCDELCALVLCVTRLRFSYICMFLLYRAPSILFYAVGCYCTMTFPFCDMSGLLCS